MKHPFTYSCLLVGLLFLSLTTFAQPAVQTIVHETQTQQQSIVQFNQSPLSGGTVAAQWTLKIGGVTIVGAITSVVAGLPSGRVLINFNLAGLAGHGLSEPYLKPGEALTFSFSNAGNTLKNGAGTQNAIAFANVASTNNWVGDCSDLGFFQQGNFSAPRFCSPVVMDFYEYKYYLSLRVRNSSVFAGGVLINEVTWGDGSPLQQEVAYQSDAAGTASSTFSLPQASDQLLS